MNKSELLKLSNTICAGIIREDMNLFDMASFKEFRHSAIIGFLLNRKEHGNRLHLKSFLERVLPEHVLSEEKSPFSTDAAEIRCEAEVECGGRRRPIDILVRSENAALIIENKCRGASDQDAQIVEYWKGVQKRYGLNDEQIYVLYIPPLNSFEEPSDSSLGELKTRLDEKNGNLKGHLITSSFRDLILPWLRDDVLPNLCFGTGILVNSLRCYIDLIEGMFGERKGNRDERELARVRFQNAYKTGEGIEPNNQELWSFSAQCLADIDTNLNDPGLTENAARSLEGFRRALWDIRSVLREKNPLLDPSNLSYEVYWLLRNNPTAFAAQNAITKLDSGLFFKEGKKRSAWDNPVWKNHRLECWFHHDEFAEFCRGNEKGGAILTFGIGNVNESDFQGMQMLFDRSLGRWTEYDQANKWRSFGVPNDIFSVAKNSQGGKMLWKIADTIAKESKKFSKSLEDEWSNLCSPEIEISGQDTDETE